jgi:hypothetical protein
MSSYQITHCLLLFGLLKRLYFQVNAEDDGHVLVEVEVEVAEAEEEAFGVLVLYILEIKDRVAVPFLFDGYLDRFLTAL